MTKSTPGNYVRYITTVAETKATPTKAKNQSWQDFTDTIGPNTPMAVVWRMAKAFANRRADQPQDKGGWIEPFLSRFSPDWVLPEPPVFADNGQGILPIFSKPFTLKDLEITLAGATDSAPGKDGITYSMLQNLPEPGMRLLLSTFNSFW